MCESKAQGGKRCSSDAKKAMDTKFEAYMDAMRARLSGEASPSDEDLAKMRAEHAVAKFWYDTTPEGQAALREEVATQKARADSHADRDTAEAERDTYHDMRHYLDGAVRVRDGQQAASEQYRRVQRGEVGPNTARALAEERVKAPETITFDNGKYTAPTVRKQIGVLAVEEPFDKTQYYEVAAWHTEHTVKPGIYPVYLTDEYSGGHMSVRYDTTVKDEYMPALFGGVPIGVQQQPARDIGKDSTIWDGEDVYALPSAYTPGLKWRGGHLVLRAGVDFGTNPHTYRWGSEDRFIAHTALRITEPKPSSITAA